MEIISRQNLNEYLETLHLAPTQFCDLPGFYRKLRSQDNVDIILERFLKD